MTVVRVSPQEYTYTTFQPAEIERIAARLATEIGLAAQTIEIEIDESTPLGRTRIESVDDPVRLHIEGGALEDPTAPRELSERLTSEVVGRLLLKVDDRVSGRFAAAPADGDLTLQQGVAWDITCMGRLDRAGYDVRQPRRRYIFRTRHGFNDTVDAVFDRLWNLSSPTWDDVEAACAETAAVRQPV